MASTVGGCVLNSAFSSLLAIPIGINSFAIWWDICAITASIKDCKSIIKKTRKKYVKIVLSAKSKLDNIEVLIVRILINSTITHNEFCFNK